jgi:hypothetical protein
VADKTTKQEEPKLTLPAGHPKASYVGPDLTFREDPNQILPEESQKAYDELVAAREKEVAAAAEAEDKAAKEEADEREKATAKAQEAQTAAPDAAPRTTSSSASKA